MSLLLYTIGLPGAGKTTLARGLSFWLSVDHLRGDKIGLELFRFPTYSAQERKVVYGEMGRRAGESLRAGKHILYDAAVNTRAQRQQLESLAAEHGGKAVGIWIQVPIELAKQRAGKLRDSGLVGPVARIIPPRIFDQYAAAFEAPSADENVILVTGTHPFSLQYRRITRQVSSAKLSKLIQ